MTEGDGEAACELTVQAAGAWDHPLTRKEKMQRLLQLFEQELHDREHELAIARLQNSDEQPRSSGDRGEKKQEEEEVEAAVVLGGGGSCTIRGTPGHVATVLKALGGSCVPVDVAPPSRRASWVSCRASSHSSSSGASTPRSAANSPTASGADHSTASRFSFGPLAPASSAAPLRPLGLPGLQLRGLGDTQGQLSARPADSTPPGSSTPGRAFGLATPRSSPFVATPRSASRVWSLVTPRGLSPLPVPGLGPAAGPAGNCGVSPVKPRTPVVPVLQQLQEENNAEHDGEAEQEDELKLEAASTDGISEADEDSIVNLDEVSFAEQTANDGEDQVPQPTHLEPQLQPAIPASGGVDVLGMDDATRFAALGSMPAEQRTAVLEAMRLWAEAAAELQQPAPLPARRDPHAVLREVRKEKLRPWRVAPKTSKSRPLRAEPSAPGQAEEAGDVAVDAVVWARNGFLSLREKSLGAKAEVASAAARLRQGVVSATASANAARTSATSAAAAASPQ